MGLGELQLHFEDNYSKSQSIQLRSGSESIFFYYHNRGWLVIFSLFLHNRVIKVNHTFAYDLKWVIFSFLVCTVNRDTLYPKDCVIVKVDVFFSRFYFFFLLVTIH